MKKIGATERPHDIDSYISGFPEKVQNILQKVRETIKAAAPNAEETISYGMPAFTYYGIVVYLQAMPIISVFTLPPPGIKSSRRPWPIINEVRVLCNFR